MGLLCLCPTTPAPGSPESRMDGAPVKPAVVSETDGAPGSLWDSTPVAAAVSLTSMASLSRTN